ncbi:hypothetical protein SAMN05414139_09236 [Burkholderia sp. D7]|nr:hypothetical protein SAMN05414139_09236 [Burkholderia sp. D7]
MREMHGASCLGSRKVAFVTGINIAIKGGQHLQ